MVKGAWIKRQDVLSTVGVADLLRSLADQIEAEHAITLGTRSIVLAHQVDVRQEYGKEGMSHTFQLCLRWDEALSDQTKVQDNSQEEEEELPEDIGETGVPTTPLEMPGADERARLRGR